MTFREAFKESMRRHGMNEAEIEERLAFGKMASGVSAEFLNMPVRPGTEELCIQSMQQLGAFMLEHKEDIRPVMEAMIRQRNRKN